MKNLLAAIIPMALLFASCSKQEIIQPPVDESKWLQQERGIVAASNISCAYFVVETSRGYAFLRAWGAGTPMRGSVLYGSFSSWGVNTFYNRSGGYLMNADVQDNFLSWWQATENMDWNCGKQ